MSCRVRRFWDNMMYSISELNKMLALIVPIILSVIMYSAVIVAIVYIILHRKDNRKKEQTNLPCNTETIVVAENEQDVPTQTARTEHDGQGANIKPAVTDSVQTYRKSYKIVKKQVYKRNHSDQVAIEVLHKNKVPLKLCNSKNNGFFFEPSEAEFYHCARAWAEENGYILLSKVREADIIRIDDLDKYPFNRILFQSISQKHFDFVFFRQYNISTPQYNCIPILIVEIDGLSHEDTSRKRRDKMVDLLVEKYNRQPHVWRRLDIIHLRKCYVGESCLWQEVIQACDNTIVGDSALPIEEILNKFLKVNERS